MDIKDYELVIDKTADGCKECCFEDKENGSCVSPDGFTCLFFNGVSHHFEKKGA